MQAMSVVVAGITMPFFPMRPRKGAAVTANTVKQLWADVTSGQFLAQKKLNGDRACLGVQDGKVVVINRRGQLLQHPVSNTRDFLKLPSGTILDGEVWQKGFYPFEALIVGGNSLLKSCPIVREKTAIEISKTLGHTWLFTPPTLEWLSQLKANLPTWEGLVLKHVNTSYIMLGSETQDSPMWLKRKW